MTLIVISRLRNLARRLAVPVEHYGAARRLLRDKIGEHDDPIHRHRAGPGRPRRAGRSLTVRLGGLPELEVQRSLDDRCGDTMAARADLEGLPEDQPGEHPDQGVPGDRIERRRSRSTSCTASARRASSRRSWCPHCEREVPNAEIVKGYEFEKGRYVVLTEEDFDKVRPESTRVIDLVQFADDVGDRSDVRRPHLLPGAGRRDGGRRVRGDARRDEGQGRHRQAGAVRPRVSGRRAAARAAAS